MYWIMVLLKVWTSPPRPCSSYPERIKAQQRGAWGRVWWKVNDFVKVEKVTEPGFQASSSVSLVSICLTIPYFQNEWGLRLGFWETSQKSVEISKWRELWEKWCAKFLEPLHPLINNQTCWPLTLSFQDSSYLGCGGYMGKEKFKGFQPTLAMILYEIEFTLSNRDYTCSWLPSLNSQSQDHCA